MLHVGLFLCLHGDLRCRIASKYIVIFVIAAWHGMLLTVKEACAEVPHFAGFEVTGRA